MPLTIITNCKFCPHEKDVTPLLEGRMEGKFREVKVCFRCEVFKSLLRIKHSYEGVNK